MLSKVMAVLHVVLLCEFFRFVVVDVAVVVVVVVDVAVVVVVVVVDVPVVFDVVMP